MTNYYGFSVAEIKKMSNMTRFLFYKLHQLEVGSLLLLFPTSGTIT